MRLGEKVFAEDMIPEKDVLDNDIIDKILEDNQYIKKHEKAIV